MFTTLIVVSFVQYLLFVIPYANMFSVKISIQVNDDYMRTLEMLSKKLKFVEGDPMVKTSKALKDVQPELEKLRQKAVAKVIVWFLSRNHNASF